MMQRRMLSKEEEATTEENEVRREDQDKINRFSRLHQQGLNLEEEQKTMQKDKEDLEEVSNELELADEDEKVQYKLGDVFLSLPLSGVQELLASNTTKIDEELATIDEKLGSIREEKDQLKTELYARFGRSINLET